MTNRELRAHFEHAMSVFNRFERLPIPTIVAVQGHCFGGDAELAIRAEEQTLGIVTLLGGVYRVADKAGRARAAEIAFTSAPIPAITKIVRW
jgi:enoyl-CoA hydratase/carnithine racemase